MSAEMEAELQAKRAAEQAAEARARAEALRVVNEQAWAVANGVMHALTQADRDAREAEYHAERMAEVWEAAKAAAL